MNKYRVSWEVDLEAESAEAAARLALDYQRNPESIATVFNVRRQYESGRLGEPQSVDLTELDEARGPQERKPAEYGVIVDGKRCAARFSTRAAALAYAKRKHVGKAIHVFHDPLTPKSDTP